MKKVLNIIIAIILSSTYCAGKYEYQLIKEGKQKIHIVTINPAEYQINIVKAHDAVMGRKKPAEIALDHNAQIVINAGFFQIDNNEDGRSTGTLISDGKLYGLRVSSHHCLIKKDNKFSIEKITPYADISIGSYKFKPKRYNRYATGKNIFFFNNAWNHSAVSKKNTRKELVLNKDFSVIKITNGGSILPENGYVISFPKDYDINNINIGMKGKISYHPNDLFQKNSSAVMGLPQLVKNEKLIDNLQNKRKEARTAVGIKKNGDLIFVIAEHDYSAKIAKKLGDILSFSPGDSNSIKGLTSHELAKIMLKIGSFQAINLDGGGSSSLYMNGEYINSSTGDKDEGMGLQIVRPISDAIIIRKK